MTVGRGHGAWSGRLTHDAMGPELWIGDLHLKPGLSALGDRRKIARDLIYMYNKYRKRQYLESYVLSAEKVWYW